MFTRVLKRLRNKIQDSEYVMTYHARKEMLEDRLTIYDIENSILSGKIIERQREKLTGKMKYRIKGKSFQNENIEVIAKISPNNKLVIITVYLLV